MFSKKYLFIFLLALTLGSLPSCLNKEPANTANPPASAPALTATTDNQIKLAQPIDCNLGKDCFIMHYVDRDPSPAVLDFNCGRQTYDGHNGTDFAIPDEKVMAKGVAVTASAAGKVLRIRDGEPDRRVEDQTTKTAVEGKECGNGVVIDHGNGWQTQYCHLRQGSIAVEPGKKVDKGTVLGMVGSSGLASFPHVHLSVRYQGKEVDPFVGTDNSPSCQVQRRPLWEQNLPYVPTGFISAGFSTKQPNEGDAWKGELSDAVVSKDSQVLFFWVYLYGVLSGDRQQVRLVDPTGKVMAEDKRDISSSRRAWLSYVGKKNTASRPIVAGVWQAEYQLLRGDKVLIDVKREVRVE